MIRRTKSRLRKRYNIIYADPPWTYQDTCNAGKRGAFHKYDLMTLADIAALPIHKISAPNCWCFMWATSPLLPEAFQVMKAWGFQYRTVAFTWVKRTRFWKLFWGMGRYTRANSEYVLLGVKGKLKRESAGVHQIIESRVREHSQKPSETRDKIVELAGDISRVELFARDETLGWDIWGNEVSSNLPLDPNLW